ncbi:MAG TPA: hypothetical protein DCP92_09670 [Nitrospiraceae bacterium]|jgi:2-polyprenyl-3-methyl-5-hydroxy-6-metoxy-1,4-benzoquinol methylase|nr:hypothetical protein [Nitrospiraceae bacterium]
MITRQYQKRYKEIFEEVLLAAPKGYFDESALPSYTHNNRLMSWLFWKRIEAALSLAGDLRNKSVLDFGCGGGVTFRYLAERQCEIVGCDNQFHQLAKDVCAKLGIVAHIHQDISEIRGRKFDVIFALDVLEHIEAPDHIIDKFLTLSHDKTAVVLSGPTENMFYRIGRRLAGFSGHYHLRNIYEIEKMLSAKKLKKKVMRNFYGPFPLFRISSWTA